MGLTSVLGGGVLWGFEVGSAGRFRVVSVPAAVRRNNNREPGSEVAVEAEVGEGGAASSQRKETTELLQDNVRHREFIRRS